MLTVPACGNIVQTLVNTNDYPTVLLIPDPLSRELLVPPHQ